MQRVDGQTLSPHSDMWQTAFTMLHDFKKAFTQGANNKQLSQWRLRQQN